MKIQKNKTSTETYSFRSMDEYRTKIHSLLQLQKKTAAEKVKKPDLSEKEVKLRIWMKR